MQDAEAQRERIIEVARKKGVDCPEMVVERAEAILGGGLVEYRCKEDDPAKSLQLSPEEAEYVGIDMSVPNDPETGGY